METNPSILVISKALDSALPKNLKPLIVIYNEGSRKNIYECKEIKEILQSLPKEKQIEVPENQAHFEAVAKMIEQNNLILLEQMKALQLIQK